jgi:hypothetical protein
VKVECKIELYCDNLSLVEEVQFSNKMEANQDALKPEFDLLIAILRTRQELQRRTARLAQAKHVKGHQDETTREEDLSPQARLNIAADRLASKAMKNVLAKDRALAITVNPHCKAYLLNEGKVWTRAEMELLRWKKHDLMLSEYHEKSMGIDEKTLHQINWAAWTIIQRNIGIRERKYAIKLTTDWLPTGTRLEKYGNLVTECHKCGGWETCNHIVQCPAKATEKLITIQNLDKMLKTMKTTDDVRHALVAGVELWLHRQKVKESVAISKRTAKAIRIQNAIGWDMAMRGRLANEWAAIQEHNGNGVPRGRMRN